MKRLLLLLTTFAIISNTLAGIKQSLLKDSLNLSKYDIVISFNSICCGPPSDNFLHEFVDSFNNKNRVHITGWQLGSCGREGESKILFTVKGLKKIAAKRFIKSIKKSVSEQNNKNKMINESSGEIIIEYNISFKDISNCRGTLQSFYTAKK